jgi:hypothetical protein
MLVMLKLAFPVLFTVTDCAPLVEATFWLLKVRLGGVTPAKGAVPVPARITVCGLPVALSVMVTEAERDPKAVGVKATLIVQLPPAATGLPQVLFWAKSPEFVPVTTRALTLKLAFPVLFTVTV